jgi:hypothetical protein
VPGGERVVDQLKEGDEILGYDISAHSILPETVSRNSFRMVPKVLSINDGLLYTTLTDQPIYVKNGTWEGWVLDPVALHVGEKLLLPLSGKWVRITNVDIISGSFKVYLTISLPTECWS